MNSLSIRIKSMLYQYINLRLLGYKKHAKIVFINAKKQAIKNNLKDLIEFCKTIKNWIKLRNLKENEKSEIMNVPEISTENVINLLK